MQCGVKRTGQGRYSVWEVQMFGSIWEHSTLAAKHAVERCVFYLNLIQTTLSLLPFSVRIGLLAV